MGEGGQGGASARPRAGLQSPGCGWGWEGEPGRERSHCAAQVMVSGLALGEDGAFVGLGCGNWEDLV